MHKSSISLLMAVIGNRLTLDEDHTPYKIIFLIIVYLLLDDGIISKTKNEVLEEIIVGPPEF